MREKIAVISMSGGLDSTCLALKLLNEGYHVYGYAFDYGQRHNIELEKLKKNVYFLQVECDLAIDLHIIDVRSIFNESCSCLNDRNVNVPKGEYDESNMKSTVVENRNVIFAAILYGKALSIAKRENKNVSIALGIHAGDHTLYPDTTQESRDAVEYACKISNWDSERVNYITPFVDFEKHVVLREGVEAARGIGFEDDVIEQILANTHSCYDPDSYGNSCGRCGTCKERLEAFEKCGLIDPIKYIGINDNK